VGRLHAVAVEGLPEILPGHDLAAEIVAAHGDLLPGDVVVVSSKVVAKAEGRVVRGRSREQAVDDESVRVVAERGDLKIVETRHGLVLAAAGVDASNTEHGSLVLLPLDPDRSARSLRAALQDTVDGPIAVVITDTAGRPWRLGQTDIAIGAAGLMPLLDLRGTHDTHDNALTATMPAVADEIAGACELVMGKTSGTPAAVVRGLQHLVQQADGPGASSLVRGPDDDLFPVGSFDVVRSRRTVRTFSDRDVPRAVVESAVGDALTAPAPHHTTPWRFVIVSDSTRERFLDAMADRWRADLRADGLDSGAIDEHVGRGDLLRRAPSLVVPCLVSDGAHGYPDDRRATAEQSMFQLAMGAGIENFLISLAVHGVGSAWVSSTLFCPEVARDHLALPDDWQPMGCVAIGYPASPAGRRTPRDVGAYILDA
jgi:coenzyme F420-0:L-glutamate ligase/coenzyme F420-1:gamma-L-glutamate ligase